MDPETASLYVESGGNRVKVDLQGFDWPSDSEMVRAQIDGAAIPVQYHGRIPCGYKLQMCGAMLDVLVRSPQEQHLSQFIKEKEVVDTSKFLLSPMPGVLVSLAVNVGDKVFAGQDMCVVEAMKMQ